MDVAAPAGCTWTASSPVAWIVIRAGTTGSGNGSVQASVATNGGNARTATISVAGRTVTIDQAPPAAPSCSYDLKPTTRNVGREAEEFSVDLNAPASCTWTAESQVSWITTENRNRTGSGSVRIAVSANAGGPRTGTVRVATETITVHQAGGTCTYTIKPTQYQAGRGPDDITVNVTAESGCAWTATTDASWITVAAGRSGSGNGTVRLSVEANPGAPRSAVVTIAGHPFTVRQDGNCSYSIKPTWYHAGRGPDNIRVNVTAPSGCTWSAKSPVTWVTVTEGRDGSGDGVVQLRVDANSGPPRTTQLTIASETFDLRQDGVCTYSIKPTWYDAGRGPDDIRVDVTAPSGCTWSVNNPVTWVTVAEGREGSGNGTVRLLVDANSGAARTAQLTIAGATFDLRQSGCTTTIKPTWYDAGRGPDDIQITVTADSGCTWTTSSSVSWVTVAEGASGSGTGVVRLLVQANSGAPRSVTLTVAGQPFALRQNGAQ